MAIINGKERGDLIQIDIGPAPDYEVATEWWDFSVDDPDDSYNHIGDMQIVLAHGNDGTSTDLATYDVMGPTDRLCDAPLHELVTTIKFICEDRAKRMKGK